MLRVDALRRYQERGVIDLDLLFGADPAVAWHAKQASAVDHLAARFGHGRNTKFHSSSERLTIPRRMLAAMVFFPDSKPGEIGPLPHIAKEHLAFRRERGEAGLFMQWIHQMGGVGRRHGRGGVKA